MFGFRTPALLLLSFTLACVALLYFATPAAGFTVYRIDPEADWLVSGYDEFSEEDDGESDFGDDDMDLEEEEEEDVAAFDQDALEDAEVVVEDDDVRPAWAGGEEKGLVLAQESANQAFTSFVVELDEPENPSSEPGSLKAEQFGPPAYFVVGSPHQGTENDVMKVEALGGGLYGSLEEEDPANKYYVLRVEYFCKKAGKAKIGVTYTFINMMEEVKNVTFFWTKECTSGVRRGFSIDASLGDEARSVPVVADGVVTPGWQDPFINKVSFGVHTTMFYLQMDKGAGSQDYDTPLITVSKPQVLQVHATAPASYGPSVLAEDIPKSLAIIYKCLALSEEDVLVTVKFFLGSHDPVEFGWHKSCSQAGVHQGLKISTLPDLEVGDVYHSGAVQESWTLAKHSQVVSKNVSSSLFYLSAQSFLTVNAPRVLVQPGNIVRARLLNADRALTPRDDVWIDSTPTALRVEYKCLQRGKALIKLSAVFTDMHDSVEVAWIKECPQPSRPTKRVSSPYLTANKAMLLFTLTMVVACGLVVWAFQARQRYQKRLAEERRKALETQYY